MNDEYLTIEKLDEIRARFGRPPLAPILRELGERYERERKDRYKEWCRQKYLELAKKYESQPAERDS